VKYYYILSKCDDKSEFSALLVSSVTWF